MDSFHRLFPYVWPYRKRLYVSIVLGFFVAAFWGMNLTVAFPIVKVLLERKNLHEYVDETLLESSENEAKFAEILTKVDSEITQLERDGVPTGDQNYVSLLSKRANAQSKIAEYQRSQYQFHWVQCYLMPIVPRNEFQTFSWLVIVLLIATAVKGVLVFFQDYLVGSVAESAVMGVRKDLLDKTLKLDYQTLSVEGHSGLMARFTYDAEQLSQGISLLGGRMIREPLKCLACMVLALIVNWRLTLLSLIFIPVLGFILARFGKMLKRASGRMMDSMSQIYKVLDETFAGLKVVIGYNNADHHKGHFKKQYDSYYSKAMKVLRIDSAAKPTLELLGLIALFMALVPGAYLVLRGKTEIYGIKLSADVMSPAKLSLLYAMLAGMLDPCRKLSSSFSRLKRSSAAIDRIFFLIDKESLISEPLKPVPLARHQKSIEFKDISFRYSTTNPKLQRGLVLEHVDLKVKAGEVIAIVGQNGCGKSTLVNLLPRYFDPDAGDVLIDGISIKDVTTADLRSQVGIVTQETILFDDTILENIRYGTQGATREQAEEAARQAHVMPIIHTMPQGFDTVLGDKGKDLSGGQRQRIALARVILRNPAILILDEATSAADPESETLIHETLKEFVKGRTTFMISHTMSQSLLDFVTRIVVMENGKVVATGTHAQLLELSPVYNRLFNSASRVITNQKSKAA